MTPAQLIRDAASAVQSGLDRAAERTEGRSIGKVAALAARIWSPVWWVGVTSIATAFAWTLSLLLHLPSPVNAAAAALVTVTLSVSRSLRAGISLIGGTILALLVALGLYTFWGLHVWTVGVLVAVSLTIGLAVRLGPQGALQIPATALFTYVLGSQITDSLIVERILATLLGVVVGLLFSLIAHPERPEERFTRTIAELNDRLGTLLIEMGHRCAEGAGRVDTAQWLVRGRDLDAEVTAVGRALDDSGLGGRFSVGRTRASGEALRAQYVVLAQAAQHVNGVIRGLLDATADGRILQTEDLGSFLVSAGTVLGAQAEAMPKTISRGGDPVTQVMRAVTDAEVHRARSVEALKNADDTDALLLGGGIVSELGRLVDGVMRDNAGK